MKTPFSSGGNRRPAVILAVAAVVVLIGAAVMLFFLKSVDRKARREQAPPTMVTAPGATFTPGAGHSFFHEMDEEWAEEVTVREFQIDINEVTNAEYEKCVSAGACRDAQKGECLRRTQLGRPWPKNAEDLSGALWEADHPVVCVSRAMAAAYCKWAQKSLPAEPQWALAAGDADGRVFPWGDEPEPVGDTTSLLLKSSAWLEGLANHGRLIRGGPEDADGFAATAPAGSFPDGASPVGALDMAGNVWEWTTGCYEHDEAADTCALAPVRGGSWRSHITELRIANRAGLPPLTRADDVGFRCVKN